MANVGGKGLLKGFWGSQNSKILEKCQTAGLIVNKCSTCMQIRLHVNGHSWLNKLAPGDPEGHYGRGGYGTHIELWENCH